MICSKKLPNLSALYPVVLCVSALILSGCQLTQQQKNSSLNSYYAWLANQPENVIQQELGRLISSVENNVENNIESQLKLAALYAIPSTSYFNPYTAKSHINSIKAADLSPQHQHFIVLMKGQLDQQIILRNEKAVFIQEQEVQKERTQRLRQENHTLKKQIQQLKSIELEEVNQ